MDQRESRQDTRTLSHDSRARRRPSVLWGLTERELRGDLIVLCVVLWTIGVVNFVLPGSRLLSGQVKGTDFLHFYTIGAAVDRGELHLLYDAEGLATLQQRLVPDSADVRYFPVYGPQVALVFAPLAKLPYLVAFLAWTAFTALAYALCVFRVWQDCPNLRGRSTLVILGAAGFAPFWNLFNHGQTTALPLLSLTGVWLALKARRPWLAGMALGTLAVKPQLGLAFACVCLATAQWRMIGGAILAIVVQAAAVWALIGSQPLQDYVRVLGNLGSLAPFLEPKLAQLHSLRAFWALLLPGPWSTILYVLSSAGVLWLTIRLWRRADSLPLRYITASLATVLVAPHLTVYDLTVLAPALLLATDWALTQWSAGSQSALVPRSILALYAMPIVPIAVIVRLQPSVLAAIALLWGIASSAESRGALTAAPRPAANRL